MSEFPLRHLLLLICTINGLVLIYGSNSSIGNTYLQNGPETQSNNCERFVFANVTNKNKCFIIISKKELTLRVYEDKGIDTLLIAQYPVCLGKNYGNKEKSGDMKTPESTLKSPFYISKISNSSKWTHDFKDGRGSIKAYGHWFLLLTTPGHKGIGIHGSTNNEKSVPGRFSEGCIRLRDQDIIELKEKYVFIGEKVVIKSENCGFLSFE